MSGHKLATLLFVALAACGSTRTSPATQTTIAAFDASKSDPKAVAIADQVVAALGGEANWAKAKEVSWTQGIIIDGKLQDVGFHAWDRWNGRHQYKKWYQNGGRATVMHEMFADVSAAFSQGPKKTDSPAPAIREDKVKAVAEAQKRFDIDTYFLFLPFKLKEPGVKLKFSEERQEEGAPADSPMKYDVIQITFDQGVGPASGDTWYLSVSKETHIPNMIEHVAAGKPDTERGGFILLDWVDAGGLKFATKRITLGYTKLDAPKVKLQIRPEWTPGEKVVDPVPFSPVDVPSPGEVVLVTGIKISDSVTDDLYVPSVM